MTKAHEGYLFIADITGYTRYLSESELEHAQDTLTALLELLVEKTRPPLVISRLAGDAVISYGLRESFYAGQTFIEKIENTYVAFRKAIERLALNNTCRCTACANISSLDLKFFIHYGTFGLQHISDHEELVGKDVNLIHRLLKNSVTEKTGIQAYALYTEAAVWQLGIDEMAEGMRPHAERYEHLEEVQVWVQDLQPVWEARRSSATVIFPDGPIWTREAVDLSIPREQAWDYLVQPEFRITFLGADRIGIANRKEGRMGAGSIYQCYHGDKEVPMTILEWQPFDYMILSEGFPNLAVRWLSEYQLSETEKGTRLTMTSTYPTGPPVERMLVRLLWPVVSRKLEKQLAAYIQRIEADYQRRSAVEPREVEVDREEMRAAAREELLRGRQG